MILDNKVNAFVKIFLGTDKQTHIVITIPALQPLYRGAQVTV